MAAPTGEFIWYELITTDPAAAARFYSAVLGWTTRVSPGPHGEYTELHAGPAGIGGIMAIPPNAAAMGARPAWDAYISTADVDSHVAQVVQAGGRLCMAPTDIPGVGRFAVVADPQGATFNLMSGLQGDGPPPVPPGTPGHMGWHELMATDLDAAWAFYAGQFGWVKSDAIDMGPMGLYQLFSTHGGAPVGGMMTKPAAMPRAAWCYYVNVDSAQAAVDRVKAHGGQVINGPHEVPGGAWVAQCLDPQGAVFAVVGPGNAA